jgi:hypothetical protein
MASLLVNTLPVPPNVSKVTGKRQYKFTDSSTGVALMIQC